MLAPSVIPDRYQKWNIRYGDPHGRKLPLLGVRQLFMFEEQIRFAQGPFSVQPNNSTRAFEYPWAFEMGNLRLGTRVLEVGGGLSGFQFVLAQCGCLVVNVDPGMNARGRLALRPSIDGPFESAVQNTSRASPYDDR
jgi:hypothetical protein